MSKPSFVVLNSRIRFDGKCESTKAHCGAVCCKNQVILLDETEVSSGQYEYTKPSEGCSCNACELMRATGKFALKRHEQGCMYLDGMNSCSIYENRPSACREFSCESTWWNLSPHKSK